MQDIHEIKPPVMVGMDPALIKILVIAAGCLLLAALLFYLFKRFWKSSGSKADDLLPSPIPPYEEAVKALDRLANQEAKDLKFFYFELGALFKAYVGRSYQIHASEMTTQELARQLRSTAMDRNLVTGVVKFQEHSDPFRYGPVLPEPGRTRQDIETARQLIEAIEQDLNKTRESDPEQGRDVDRARPEKERPTPYTKLIDVSVDGPGRGED
ncbi:hypothetical protein [Desulfospira joergensenii]|uniref:hypothetical protein n=1 Tax=Desulfospira joergensenii TaxID=53329 RepID=UPI0003B4A225|nr:hypothetical protein [Desulfospira joergensenii]